MHLKRLHMCVFVFFIRLCLSWKFTAGSPTRARVSTRACRRKFLSQLEMSRLTLTSHSLHASRVEEGAQRVRPQSRRRRAHADVLPLLQLLPRSGECEGFLRRVWTGSGALGRRQDGVTDLPPARAVHPAPRRQGPRQRQAEADESARSARDTCAGSRPAAGCIEAGSPTSISLGVRPTRIITEH